MKNLRTAVLCAGIALCSLGSFAQNPTIPINEPDYNKPKLFANLPDRIPVSVDDMNSFFNTQLGQTISLSLSTDVQTRFEGTVIALSGSNPDRIETIIIRSTNFNGARFTLSRITNADGSLSYTGRIISFQHGDLYELQNKNGVFVLVKRNFYDLVNEEYYSPKNLTYLTRCYIGVPFLSTY